MSILKGVYYSRPTAQYLSVEREPVEGQCHECGAAELKRYPAFTQRGPKIVTKCQACFALAAEEEPDLDAMHPPFWPMTRRWLATRAG
jgi:hypothetical protein